MNASMVIRYGSVAREFLYSLEAHHGEYEKCIIFGVTGIGGRCLSFNIMLETGAMWTRIPIHALRWQAPTSAGRRGLSELEIWDCFCDEFDITVYDYLDGRECAVKLGGMVGFEVPAEYWLTIDFKNNGYSDFPGQHKQFHLVALQDGTGQLAALPGNNILWDDPSFVRRGSHKFDYTHTADKVWRAESRDAGH